MPNHFKEPKFSESISTINNDKRPFVQVTILEHKLYGLLDTGSNISACDTVAFQFFKSLHLKSYKCKRFSVTAANGATEIVYELIYACIEYNGQTKVVEIYHTPGLSRTFNFRNVFLACF